MQTFSRIFFVDSRFRHTALSQENGWVSSYLLLILVYFVIACLLFVFDFPCFGSCSERFQGKRFQGMRVLRKSSCFVILFFFSYFVCAF